MGKSLGKSDLQISSIGYGCMGISEFYGHLTPKKEAVHLLQSAFYDYGVTFFDTADMYGKGLSEQMLGDAIQSFRNQVVVATKCGILRTDKEPIGNFNLKVDLICTPEYIKKACDLSLKNLNVSHIDLYYLHRHNPTTPIEEAMGAMKELIDAGKILSVGLSEVDTETIQRAHSVLGDKLVAIQTEYSFQVREPAELVMPICRKLGISFVAYSPIARGMLSGNFRNSNQFSSTKVYDFRADVPFLQEENLKKNLRSVEAIAQIAKSKHCTSAQLSLAWLLAQGDNIIPIPGTSNPIHLKENMEAANIFLSPEELIMLDKIHIKYPLTGER